MDKKILILFILVMMIGLVTPSQDSLGTYKQGEDVILLQICGTCSYNNITSIVLPNSTHLEIDTEMTKRGMEYTYTFSQTDLAGTYLVNGVGDLDGTANAWAYEVLLTPSGNSGSSNIVFFIFIILMIYTINLFGFFGKNEIMTLLGGMALLFLGVYIINNGIIIYRDTLTNYFAYVTIAWGAVSSLWAGLALMEIL